MKKIIILTFLTVLLVACGSIKMMDVSKLELGMTKSEVKRAFGGANKVLQAQNINGHHEETLEYSDISGEPYILIFQDNTLVKYSIRRDRPNRPNRRH